MDTETNKRIVLGAFDSLFNKRDYAATERFWPPAYIQNSAYIAPARDGLFDLIKSLPASLRYQSQLVLAEGYYVILHGRFSGHGLRRNWIVADVVRLENGLLAQHWDVIQDEATQSESKSGRPMFGSTFATDVELGTK